MIPFYLITGFLGSGKTTYLKKLLENSSPEKRIVVIQNEFAPSGIDGIELKIENSELKIVEVNNGSVFCSCLIGSFIETLKTVIKKYNPTEIYLEASGLSDPVSLNEIINEKELNTQIFLDGSVCIVDALNFEKALSKMPRVQHQIRIADQIVLNKIDLVNINELTRIKEKIRQLNTYVNPVSTSFCVGVNSNAQDHPKKNQFFFFKENKQSGGRPDLKSAVIKTSRKIAKENIEFFIEELKKIAIRAKGFLLLEGGEVILFQQIYQDSSIYSYENYDGNTEIAAIGEDLSLQQLNSIFKKYAC